MSPTLLIKNNVELYEKYEENNKLKFDNLKKIFYHLQERKKVPQSDINKIKNLIFI